ncbi:hypothetical protein SAMN02745866_03145 [Alteromonadaceae bacterium Bs31]|nr:hypothetical protein SAMN02745866_03145 [Alteromonadaceae bacterium Bs31]
MSDSSEHQDHCHSPETDKPQAHCGSESDQVPNMANQHAFFLVGDQHLFLVHMGNAWMDCHRYQMIMEISLPDHARQTWMEHRNRHPNDWYIVGNLETNKLQIPQFQLGTVRSFDASIWMGFPTTEGSEHWPWANEPTIVSNIKVKVERVVYYRRLDFSQDYPRTASYILFGKGKEAHLNHIPVKQPDFDHVLTLAEAPAWLPPELLEVSVPVNFPSVPAIPGGHSCHEALYQTEPVGPGREFVQYSGFGPGRQIDIAHTVFFGTYPFNSSKPGEPWRPCESE